MVVLSDSPLLNLDTGSVHLIDTQNIPTLHKLWSTFSQCARTHSLPNANRLENLSWRIYSQQTLSLQPVNISAPTDPIPINRRSISADSVPGLSRSPGSPTSDEAMGTPPDSDLSTGICHVGQQDSRKAISPDKLENIVKSVTETNDLEPITPLPSTILPQMPAPSGEPVFVNQALQEPIEQTQTTDFSAEKVVETTEFPKKHETNSISRNGPVESSTSTMATTGLNDSEIFEAGPALATADSTSTEMSTMSIVRGFSRDMISSSTRRSHVHLNALPPPILKQSPSPHAKPNPLAKQPKKKPTFLVGASSEGDESSYDSPKQMSSLTQGLRGYSHEKQPAMKRTTARFEFDNSESAIDDDDEEDDDDDDDWIDDDAASNHEETMFRRVDSTSNLRSRPSLLTNLIHEVDRAKALQNAASKSTSAIRRSRTSSHNGPGLGSEQSSAIEPMVDSVPAMPTNFSPRTSRMFMLKTELTGSLRKHMVWERQAKNPAAKALKNRQYRSEIRLSDHLQQNPEASSSQLPIRSQPRPIDSNNNFYDNGLQEYFEKGW